MESIDDYFPKCKGKNSNRIGIYHPQKVCHVDPKIHCSKRYELDIPTDKVLSRYKYFCLYMR